MLNSVISSILRGYLVMAYISGEDRFQLLLLPGAVDSYVRSDNPVRFIDAFVDSLDLEAAGFDRVRPRETGRLGYHPADLLNFTSTDISTGCGRAVGWRRRRIAIWR